MKKILFALVIALWGVGVYAQEQHAYIRVKQYVYEGRNSGDWEFPTKEQYKVPVSEIGSSDLYVTFDDNENAITIYKGDTISSVPMKSGVEMTVNFTPSENVDTFSTASVDAYGYGTYYSPFTTKVPNSSNFTFYLPTISQSGNTLALTRTARIIPGTILKPNTAVLVKGTKNGTVKVPLVYGVKQSTLTSKLSGTCATLFADSVRAETGKTIFTLGKAKNYNRFGFFRFVGSELKPNKAFLLK